MMFLFVVGILLSPLVAYMLYAYARIGKGIFRGAFDDTRTVLSRVLAGLLACLFHLIPLLLLIPATQSASLATGLVIGLLFVFLVTRRRRPAE